MTRTYFGLAAFWILSSTVSLGAETSDRAGWLERLGKLDSQEELVQGDIVGRFGELVSKRTARADGLAVFTQASEQDATQVLLMGITKVRVRGPVAAGQYLIASGKGDGAARAVSASELEPSDARWLVGHALESVKAGGEVKTLVGAADPRPWSELLARQEIELDELRLTVAEQAAELAKLTADTRKAEEELLERLEFVEAWRQEILGETLAPVDD